MKIAPEPSLGKDARTLSLPFLLLCFAWLMPGLVGHDPWKADEPYSFGMVYHILTTGDWVIPTVAGEPFMEKPPLCYLTAAFFARICSPLLPLHDGARLACAFFMVITFSFTALAARELFGRGYGRVAVLVLLSCVGLQNHVHKLMTDVALLSGFAVALYGLALSRRRFAAGGFWTGTGVGIGFMSKGLLAPGLLGITALVLPLFCREWRGRKYAGALAVALLSSLPWFVVWPFLLYQKAPHLFREWFWVQNFGRFFGYAHQGPPNQVGFYLYVLPWFAWPAFPLALWGGWRRWKAGRMGALRTFPLVAFLAMLAIFSLASDGRSLYALPMLIPLALLAASTFGEFPAAAARIVQRVGSLLFGGLALVLWLGWIFLLTGYPPFIVDKLHRLSPAYLPSFAPLPFFVALVYTLLWIGVVVFYEDSAHGALFKWGAGTTLVWGLSMTLWLPWSDAMRSYRPMVDQVQKSLPATYACIANKGLGESERAMFEYFGNIRTVRFGTAGAAQCDLLLYGGRRDVPPAGVAPSWRKIWEGSRPGHDKELFILYQSAGLPPGAR